MNVKFAVPGNRHENEREWIPNMTHEELKERCAKIAASYLGCEAIADEIRCIAIPPDETEEMTELLYKSLPFIEDALNAGWYKSEPVKQLIKRIRTVLGEPT